MPDTLIAQQPRDEDAILRLVADTAPAMLAYFDADTRACRFANARYAEHFGHTMQTIVGMDVRDIVGELVWTQIEPYLDSVAVDNLPQRRFSQSRAVALDMESATIAANGFRFRVPYGTLLCVSDKPLHGEIKLPGMANHFYRERVDQHLRIGMRAVDILREGGSDRLHSRKLRSFDEVAFQ